MGPTEIWAKWRSEVLVVDRATLIRKEKLRYLRKFRKVADDALGEMPLDSEEHPLNGEPLPDCGCNVEFTSVTLPHGEIWWTVGFESFGSLDDVQCTLEKTLVLMTGRHPLPLSDAQRMSQPAWLAKATNHL